MYESMSSLAFVSGYMTIMDLQPEPIRKLMWVHLKELMEDGECFGWPTVRAYHAVWLQNIEQGRATWDDQPTCLKLHRSLVWHMLAPSSQPSSTPTSTPQAPTRAPECTANPCIVNPGDRACVAFNQGMCSYNVGHPADLHVCSYCLTTTSRLWSHVEVTYNTR